MSVGSHRTKDTDEAIGVALTELRSLLEADGAGLRLLDVEDLPLRLTVGVDFKDVDCMDCVLPPAQLGSVIQAAFKKRIGQPCEVHVIDPRAPADRGRSEFVTVLDPRGIAHADDGGAGPPAGSLRGKRVGFRIDVLWPAWDVVVEEWSKALIDAGGTVETWRRLQGLAGEEGRAKQAEYVQFVRSLDVAVVGLGNCGGCTAYTIEDAMTAAEAGIPTLAVATGHFEQLARSLAAHRGRPELRLLVLPYPFHTLPEAEVRAAARAALPEMLEKLGATV